MADNETVSITDEMLKAGARNSSIDARRLQDIHDLAVENGAVCAPTETTAVIPMKATDGEGNFLKAISETPDELRVGNYIVLFGGRDLEGIASPRKNKDGSIGERFDPGVELESDYTKTGVLYVDWEHGTDPDRVGNHKDNVLGYVDWKTARRDDRGVFVERVLMRRNNYVKLLEELIKAGMVGNSTEPAQDGVQKTADGTITRWPLVRDSLTVNPMEPRMLQDNHLQQVYKSLITTPASEAVAESAADNKPAGIIPAQETMEVSRMEPNELEALLEKTAKASAEAAVKAYAESQATVKAGTLVVTADETDKLIASGNPFKSAGEYFTAVKNAALGDTDKRLKALGANEGVPSQGGFLVPPQFSTGILERMYESGSILSRVQMDTISGNSMKYNALDETSRVDGSRWGGVLGYWLNEGGTKTATKPKFRQMTLDLKKVAALAYATDELLEDQNALQGWLSRTVPAELKFQTENTFVNGDGVGKPLGFLGTSDAPGVSLVQVTRTDASKVQLADIVAMWARRWAGVNDYVWLINQDVEPQLFTMTIGSYTAAYMPPGGISAAPYGSIMGKPVIPVEYMPTLGTLGDITLASLSQYQAIQRGGVQAQTSIHVAFLTDETAFRFVYRVDGQPTWNSPLTPFKGSATQAPFVALTASS